MSLQVQMFIKLQEHLDEQRQKKGKPLQNPEITKRVNQLLQLSSVTTRGAYCLLCKDALKRISSKCILACVLKEYSFDIITQMNHSEILIEASAMTILTFLIKYLLIRAIFCEMHQRFVRLNEFLSDYVTQVYQGFTTFRELSYNFAYGFPDK